MGWLQGENGFITLRDLRGQWAGVRANCEENGEAGGPPDGRQAEDCNGPQRCPHATPREL